MKGPAHGTLSLQPDGTFSYLPAANFSGTDTFTYRASDGSAVSNVATVTLHVTPVAGRPVATPDVYTTSEGIALNVAAPGVLGNDTGSGSAITAVTDTQPQHGTATLAANGRLRYVPNAGFVGDDGFTYHDQAGQTRSERVHVTIHVRAIDHAPVAHPDAYTTPENTRLTVRHPRGARQRLRHRRRCPQRDP